MTQHELSHEMITGGKEKITNELNLVRDLTTDDLVQSSLSDFSEGSTGIDDIGQSENWRTSDQRWGRQLDDITDVNGYYDIFLITLEGNIIYTTEREPDFGRNVHDSQLQHEGINFVFDNIINGDFSASYVEPYSPSHGIYSIFLGSRIMSEEVITGVFVVQLTFRYILTAIYDKDIEFDEKDVQQFNVLVVDDLANKHVNTTRSDSSFQLYLICASPTDGSNVGTGYDIGYLSSSEPTTGNTRFCAKWLQFTLKANEVVTSNAREIYYHIWWKSMAAQAEIGVDQDGLYNTEMDASTKVTVNGANAIDDDKGFCLSTGTISLNETGWEMSSLALKLKSFDHNPVLYSGPKQTSFIIVNPEPEDVLMITHSDADTLSDYEEMYQTFTDPSDSDTDEDGLYDNLESDSNPNIYDSDLDRKADGIDPEPTRSDFDQITGLKTVTETETITGNYLVDDSILVKAGGVLSIIDAELQFNGEDKVQTIIVEKDGILNIKGSTIIMGSALDWFVNIYDWDFWHEWDHINIHGKVTIEDSTIKCASILHIDGGGKSVITNTEFRDMFYGIALEDTDAEISNVDIDIRTGYGLHLINSNPKVVETDIKVNYGFAVYCYGSSPELTSSVLKSTTDLILDADSHPVLEDTTYSTVEVRDSQSSLTPVKSNLNSFIIALVAVIGILMAFLIIRRKMHTATLKNLEKQGLKGKGNGKKASKRASRRR